MSDMLVKLYDLPKMPQTEKDYRIIRPLAPDRFRVVEWVKQNSGMNAAGECEACFAHTPVSMYIAVRGKEIIGYACYDAIAPDFFGPTRVSRTEQGKGIGKALLFNCLQAMKEKGYAYAIIGSVTGAKTFYEKTVNAIEIPESCPGIYRDYLGGEA